MAALPTTGITTSMVASAIGAATNDVGTLCSHPNVNSWSSYKPINVNSVALNQATRDYLSGFKIVSRQLVYDKPLGGSTSPYRLGDFRGYNHNARKPVNTSLTQNFLTQYDGDEYGSSTNLVTIGVTLPNTELINRMKTEFGITHCTICNSNDVILKSISLDGISETNYFLQNSVNADLSSIPVGGTYTLTFKVYYGNSTDYKLFQIPNGDTVTVTGKIIARGVRIYGAILPTDSFVPYSISSIEKTTSYDSVNNILTISYLKISGAGKNSQNSDRNFTMYSNFQSKINWELQYTVVDADGNVLVPYTRVPNWSSLNAYATQPEDLQYSMGSYYIVNGSTMTIPNVDDGAKVTFRLAYTALNW